MIKIKQLLIHSKTLSLLILLMSSKEIIAIFCAISSSESCCKLEKCLEDVEALEDSSVTLEIQLSKPRPVKWKKNGEILDDHQADSHFKLSLEEEGLVHKLTIDEVKLDDTAEYEVEVDDRDYGIIKSSSRVQIKGQLLKRTT